tara:strand:- start:925 stop:2025 length:1101 start_codon:yes stop_codon:yes gene_type:complete
MANQSVGTPVFYIDYTQLAKAKGYFRNLTDFGVNNTNGIYELDSQGARVYGEKNMNVWNFDYAKSTRYQNYQNQKFNFRLAFWNPDDSNEYSLEWAKLLQTANWGGLINHNIYSQAKNIGADFIDANFIYWSPNGDIYNNWTEDTSQKVIDHDGFTIFESTVSNDLVFSNLNNYSVLVATVNFGQGDDLGEFEFDLGSVAFGRKIEMPNAPDLDVTKSVEYDGVKTQRSLGGSDYVQINNLGCPDWVNGQPWSLTQSVSKGRIGKNGRRRWELNFSYISSDDMFFDPTKQSSFGEQNNIEDPTEFYATNEVQQIFDLTLGGALSFIFQPDKNTEEYAICRLDQNEFSTKQVSHNVYSVNMSIVETW